MRERLKSLVLFCGTSCIPSYRKYPHPIPGALSIRRDTNTIQLFGSKLGSMGLPMFKSTTSCGNYVEVDQFGGKESGLLAEKAI